MNSPLKGLRVLDLTRVLAGPYCTQMLGDLGAEIIKVERPGAGDDTRGFAPPYLNDDNGNETDLSAYYCGANRNKRSITINLSEKEGQDIIRKLLKNSDILVENFKTGTLAKYGLSYDDLKNEFLYISSSNIAWEAYVEAKKKKKAKEWSANAFTQTCSSPPLTKKHDSVSCITNLRKELLISFFYIILELFDRRKNTIGTSTPNFRSCCSATGVVHWRDCLHRVFRFVAHGRASSKTSFRTKMILSKL